MAKQEKLIKTKDRVKKHGEVFTPVKIVNDMLNLEGLKEKIEDIRTTILEPSVGEGVFLTEILKRRFNKILNESSNILEFENNALISLSTIYGIELLEDNVKKCRINIYKCFFYYYNKAICKFNSKIKDVVLDNAKKIICLNIIQGNFLTKKNNDNKLIVLTKWNNIDDTISFCDNFDKKEEIEDWNDMKFDVAIGNPPYQEMDGGAKSSAKPLYHLFVNEAKNLTKRYVSFITPSRWFTGGKGLDEFRVSMLKDNKLSILVDFPNSEECFYGVNIKGGVSYFLYDKYFTGLCLVKTIINSKTNEEKRFLSIENLDIVIRFNWQYKLLQKILKKNYISFESIVSKRNPFGIDNLIELNSKDSMNNILIYGNKKIGYVNENIIKENINLIDSYKIYISYAYGAGENFPHQIINKPIIPENKSVVTETYLVVGAFETEFERNNAFKYLKSKFLRSLVSIMKISQHATAKTYRFVPMQDFTNNSDIDWNKSIDEIDEQLFKKYGLDEEEINYIKQNIKPMQ